jgi:hypothetical protein
VEGYDGGVDEAQGGLSGLAASHHAPMICRLALALGTVTRAVHGCIESRVTIRYEDCPVIILPDIQLTVLRF